MEPSRPDQRNSRIGFSPCSLAAGAVLSLSSLTSGPASAPPSRQPAWTPVSHRHAATPASSTASPAFLLTLDGEVEGPWRDRRGEVQDFVFLIEAATNEFIEGSCSLAISLGERAISALEEQPRDIVAGAHTRVSAFINAGLSRLADFSDEDITGFSQLLTRIDALRLTETAVKGPAQFRRSA